MSGKVHRSDDREREYERYAEALLSSEGGGSIADMLGSSRPASYHRPDANLLPSMTSNLITLSEIGGPKEREESLDRPKFKLASGLGDWMNQEMVKRSMSRRIAAGLPIPEIQEEAKTDLDHRDEEMIDVNDVFASIDALLPSVSRRPDGKMNKIAQNAASDLIKVLGLSEDQTEWFTARIASGVSNPDVFRRDLRMALSSKEVS